MKWIRVYSNSLKMSNTVQFSRSRFLGDYERGEDFNSCKKSINFTIYRHLTISVKGPVFPVCTKVWKVAVVVSKAPKGWGNANEKAQKAIGLFSKTITLHVQYTFCSFLCRHCTTIKWKFLMRIFMEAVNKLRRHYSFSFVPWEIHLH